MTIQHDSIQGILLGADYRLIDPPPAAQDDLPLLLRVAVRNTGAMPWPNQGGRPVNLSYHWLGPNGQMVDFDGLRAILPQPLRPGEVAEVELQVEPPPCAGDYRLALDLVEEEVGWFSLRGVAPLLIPLTVVPAPKTRRVCIVNGNCMVNDAMGNHVVNQLRFFQARGYQVTVLLEVLDQRHPAWVRQFFAPISIEQLQRGQITTYTRRAIEHFRSADIYVFNYGTYYPLAEAIRLIKRGVVVFDYHGVTPPELWDGPGVEDLIEGRRQVGLVRFADYAIVHSGYTRDELLATGAIGPERVQVIPYVVPLDNFRPGPRDSELAARYGLDGRTVLLYIGRMASNKRIIDLVRALSIISERYPNTMLLLVGDDRTPAYVQVVAEAKAEAAHLGCADQVLFTGPVDHNQLQRYYNTCDIYVTSSLHEGFCIPAVEAMACRVPVVGTHATALPETIGDAGLTFRPRDPADLAEKVLALLAAGVRLNGSSVEFAKPREDVRIMLKRAHINNSEALQQ